MEPKPEQGAEPTPPLSNHCVQRSSCQASTSEIAEFSKGKDIVHGPEECRRARGSH